MVTARTILPLFLMLVMSKAARVVTSQRPEGINSSSNSIKEHPNNRSKPCDISKVHEARAFVVSCMDFRLIDKVEEIMVNKGYSHNYDYFILAGASLGILQRNHPEWVQAFKDHLDLSLQLHHIHEVIFIDHLDCGYYKRFFGSHMNLREEEDKHNEVLSKVKQIMNDGYPQLKFHGELINLSGSEVFKMS